MTEFSFNRKSMEDPEVVSELEMEGYEKYRLKTEEMTLDLAIVDISELDPESYIQERKNELNSGKTEVPHPYRPEKEQEGDADEKVKFAKDPVHGIGRANPEYNLVSGDDKMARYRYVVTWKKFPEKQVLTEIEAYVIDDRPLDEVLEQIRDLSISEDS